MPSKYVPRGKGQPRLKDFGDILTLAEACEATGLSSRVIRNAIKTGALPAFIPGGGTPGRVGPGLGYRIRKADLQAWFLGEPKLPDAGKEPPSAI